MINIYNRRGEFVAIKDGIDVYLWLSCRLTWQPMHGIDPRGIVKHVKLVAKNVKFHK